MTHHWIWDLSSRQTGCFAAMEGLSGEEGGTSMQASATKVSWVAEQTGFTPSRIRTRLQTEQRAAFVTASLWLHVASALYIKITWAAAETSREQGSKTVSWPTDRTGVVLPCRRRLSGHAHGRVIHASVREHHVVWVTRHQHSCVRVGVSTVKVTRRHSWKI